MKVNDNGTVCLKVNAVEDTYNIRRIISYYRGRMKYADCKE
jgi:hypothetical protein